MLLRPVQPCDYLEDPGTVVRGFHEAAEAMPLILLGWKGQAGSIEDASGSDRSSREHHRVCAPHRKGVRAPHRKESSAATYATIAKQEELTLRILQEKLKIFGWGEVSVGVRPFSIV